MSFIPFSNILNFKKDCLIIQIILWNHVFICLEKKNRNTLRYFKSLNIFFWYFWLVVEARILFQFSHSWIFVPNKWSIVFWKYILFTTDEFYFFFFFIYILPNNWLYSNFVSPKIQSLNIFLRCFSYISNSSKYITSIFSFLIFFFLPIEWSIVFWKCILFTSDEFYYYGFLTYLLYQITDFIPI